MRVDMKRIAAAAAQAALDNGEPQPRKRSGLGAVAAGAMLAVAARVAVRKAGLPHIGDLAEMPEQLRNRLAGSGRLRDEGEDLDDHEFDDEPAGGEDTDDRELEADEGADQEDRNGARTIPDEYWEHMEALEAAELRDG